MTKHRKDPLLEALEKGCPFTWTVPLGGNFASMRAAIKHGQTLTMEPVRDPSEIQTGDMVLVCWHKGYLFHMVGEIQGDQFLIVNSLGKINGWVSGSDILGRVTRVVDPEPCPGVPRMLDRLEAAYNRLIEREQPGEEDSQRLMSIVGDLRWYAARIGVERWNVLPKPNRWSFEQNVWQLTRQAEEAVSPAPDAVGYFMDCGKKCVGMASETYALFAYREPDGSEE